MSNEITFKFKNGDVLRDKVTGFAGVVMVCAAYATGCHHYGLSPRNLKDGKISDWEWLDVSRLELVESEVVTFTQDHGYTSGPSPKGPQQ